MTASPSFYFGVVFDLNNEEIALEPLTDINNAKTNGIECDLEKPVYLGEVGDNLKGILDALGADSSTVVIDDPANPGSSTINPDLEEIPVVGTIVKTLLDADVTVEKFYLKIPPSGSSAPTRYTVGMSAVWDVEAGEGKLLGPDDGGLYLKGLYLKVSNEDVTADSSSTTTTT
ncbi:MAG: hypothetical protein AAGD25_16795 [Cyanobacteria bacterium P01_F01_bin.150]